MASQEMLTLTINYDSPVEEAVAAGGYGHANPDITSRNFTTAREGELQPEAILVHFDRVITSDEVLAELDRMGLRAGELHELLAFGATYPNKQCQFPIVALGSTWQSHDGVRYVPFLDDWYDGRLLCLVWFGRVWHERCRFLAFRK